VAARNSLDLNDPKVIEAVRLLDAPCPLVWAAFSDPEHIARWWGPDGFSLTTQSFDMRPGGVWRFVMHGPDGRDYQNRITFIEVVEPERIVYRHGGGEDVEPVQFTVATTFEDADGKTRLTWRMTFPTAQHRDEVIKTYGADKGLVQTLARLSEHLARVSAT
jgi:uncharacterized protein YndB with AHSA1/START domain